MRQTATGTGGILNSSSFALLLAEYLELKLELPVNKCERDNGSVSTLEVIAMHVA